MSRWINESCNATYLIVSLLTLPNLYTFHNVVKNMIARLIEEVIFNLFKAKNMRSSLSALMSSCIFHP